MNKYIISFWFVCAVLGFLQRTPLFFPLPIPAQQHPINIKERNRAPFTPIALPNYCCSSLCSQSNSSSMSSPVRLLGRQRSVHQILGGGFIADVILWRRRDVTVEILLGALAAWVLFELSGYTLLSLVSNVLLLLFSVLFVWAKSAEILNRPPPPIPELNLSIEVISEVAVFVRCQVNAGLSVFHDIALGKDPKLFSRVAVCLLLISVVGSCIDFLSFACSGLAILLTFPVLYEKFEDIIDRYVMLALVKLYMYERLCAECFDKAKEWIMEKMKES